MDNFSYSSYPDSRGSSPRSRDVDSETQSWDEPSGNYRVKFMCSYGGKIQPRPHDNQLAYIGGDTKILSVERSVKFSSFVSKLASLCDALPEAVCFKYQLPGEDLDALISVTNDEDLEHMMLEYDRIHRAPAKPARLRLFLFPLNPPLSSAAPAIREPKAERLWFVDSLGGIPMQTMKSTSPAADSLPERNTDYLFGPDKGYVAVAEHKFHDTAPPSVRNPESASSKDASSWSDCGSEDRHAIGEAVMSPSDIQRQIHDLQKLQMASGNEQANTRIYSTGEYYAQSVPEKIAPPAGAVPVPMQMHIPAGYGLPERHIVPGGYSPASAASTGMEQQKQQPVYIISAPNGGLYQAPQGVQAVTTHAGGQAYYGVAGVVQDVYQEQPMFNTVPTSSPALHQQPKVGQYAEGIPVMQSRAGVVAEPTGYVQLGFDASGRQVYGVMPPPYQAAAPIDGRHRGGNNGGLNHDPA